MTQSTWQVFQLNELLQRIDRGGVRLHEFLRTPSLSCAIYHLPAGSNEMATAHEEDELYFVLEGRARLRVDDQDHAVEKGTLLYVEAACDHSFFDIEEDLTVIAFFGGPLPRRGASGIEAPGHAAPAGPVRPRSLRQDGTRRCAGRRPSQPTTPSIDPTQLRSIPVRIY